jgi:hypothetical protein
VAAPSRPEVDGKRSNVQLLNPSLLPGSIISLSASLYLGRALLGELLVGRQDAEHALPRRVEVNAGGHRPFLQDRGRAQAAVSPCQRTRGGGRAEPIKKGTAKGRTYVDRVLATLFEPPLGLNLGPLLEPDSRRRTDASEVSVRSGGTSSQLRSYALAAG